MEIACFFNNELHKQLHIWQQEFTDALTILWRSGEKAGEIYAIYNNNNNNAVVNNIKVEYMGGYSC